jgi:hypothetical protein
MHIYIYDHQLALPLLVYLTKDRKLLIDLDQSNDLFQIHD